MSDDIGLLHRPEMYPMGHDTVNYGTQGDALCFLPMTKHRQIPAESVGDRISQLRLAKGLSQAGLGRLLGVTRAAVHKWENGDTANMANQTFLALADALGTDPYYLAFGPTRSPPGEPPRGGTDATGRFRVGRFK